MRNFNQITQDIEHLEKLMRKKEGEIYKIKVKIDNLERLRNKARHKERLEESNKYVYIISSKYDNNYGYHNKTEKGYSWISRRKLKNGKHKVTEHFYEELVEIKEKNDKNPNWWRE